MASTLERKFSLYWKAVKGPKLEAEFKFCESRRWRADFCHLASKTLIELEGGVWSGGRHGTGKGFTADCEKYNEAAFLGYRVLRLTGDQITVPNLERIREFIARHKTS
jgi:very-short-patch-repair endonuclease